MVPLKSGYHSLNVTKVCKSSQFAFFGVKLCIEILNIKANLVSMCISAE